MSFGRLAVPARVGAILLTGACAGTSGARTAEVFACADHDADGSDELVPAHDPGVVRSAPVRWWVTDGDADGGAFDSGGFGG